MISIEVGTVVNKEKSQKFIDAIEGKSYMNFRVNVWPSGGEWHVTVETDYEASREEVQEMLNYVMFCELSK